MSELYKHDAYLTGMKHCEYGKPTKYKYYENTPFEILSFDNPLTRNKKLRARINGVQFYM